MLKLLETVPTAALLPVKWSFLAVAYANIPFTNSPWISVNRKSRP
jgi:hypothetical protein